MSRLNSYEMAMLMVLRNEKEPKTHEANIRRMRPHTQPLAFAVLNPNLRKQNPSVDKVLTNFFKN